MVNGTPKGYFRSSRGLRQGDPLSPLLFVIVMEAFSKMLEKAVGHSLLMGFVVEQLYVSHLLFVDETLIFCDADAEQFRNLHRLLLCFEVVSGLRINLGKFEAITVGDVDNVEELTTILSCRVAQLPMAYLGLPLGARFKNIQIWNNIVKVVERRLVGWKRIYLSKGGHLTLIKSTLLNLHTYFMSLFPIRGAVAKKIREDPKEISLGRFRRGDETTFG